MFQTLNLISLDGFGDGKHIDILIERIIGTKDCYNFPRKQIQHKFAIPIQNFGQIFQIVFDYLQNMKEPRKIIFGYRYQPHTKQTIRYSESFPSEVTFYSNSKTNQHSSMLQSLKLDNKKLRQQIIQLRLENQQLKHLNKSFSNIQTQRTNIPYYSQRASLDYNENQKNAQLLSMLKDLEQSNKEMLQQRQQMLSLIKQLKNQLYQNKKQCPNCIIKSKSPAQTQEDYNKVLEVLQLLEFECLQLRKQIQILELKKYHQSQKNKAQYQKNQRLDNSSKRYVHNKPQNTTSTFPLDFDSTKQHAIEQQSISGLKKLPAKNPIVQGISCQVNQSSLQYIVNKSYLNNTQITRKNIPDISAYQQANSQIFSNRRKMQRGSRSKDKNFKPRISEKQFNEALLRGNTILEESNHAYQKQSSNQANNVDLSHEQ